MLGIFGMLPDVGAGSIWEGRKETSPPAHHQLPSPVVPAQLHAVGPVHNPWQDCLQVAASIQVSYEDRQGPLILLRRLSDQQFMRRALELADGGVQPVISLHQPWHVSMHVGGVGAWPLATCAEAGLHWCCWFWGGAEDELLQVPLCQVGAQMPSMRNDAHELFQGQRCMASKSTQSHCGWA